MSYGRNRQNLLSAPDHAHFSAFKLPRAYPPHPDTPGPLVLWDEAEAESEAPIMSYGAMFAAPEAVRYSPPGGKPAGRLRSNPTDRVHRLPIPPRVPHRGMNQPPRSYPPIPMPPDHWSRGTKRKQNRRPRS